MLFCGSAHCVTARSVAGRAGRRQEPGPVDGPLRPVVQGALTGSRALRSLLSLLHPVKVFEAKSHLSQEAIPYSPDRGV